jgi:hypothetical protein
MENAYKSGYALKDKDIKFIKNYCKTLEIKTNGYPHRRHSDTWGVLINSSIKITSIRKYQHCYTWKDREFVYEVDVEIDVKNSKYMEQYERSGWYIRQDFIHGVKRMNRRYRDAIENYILNELKYMNVNENLTISKIKWIIE